jgi:type-F conjugative transfer system pilin assembly protein TrbC
MIMKILKKTTAPFFANILMMLSLALFPLYALADQTSQPIPQDIADMIQSKSDEFNKEMKAKTCKTCSSYKNGTLNSTETIGGIEIQKPKKPEEIKIPKTKPQDKQAQTAHQNFKENTDQHQTIKKYEDNLWIDIQKSFGVDENKIIPKEDIEEFAKANKTQGTYDESYLFLFISKSIPLATLKNYIEIFDQNPYVTFVLRGTIGSPEKILPTIEWIKSFQCPNGVEECASVKVDINPPLFSKFSINNVPALVYLPDPQKILSEDSISENDFLTYFGDVDPSYILDKFQFTRPDDEKLMMIKSFLTKSSYYQNTNGNSHDTP